MSVSPTWQIQQREQVVGGGRVTCFCGRTFRPDFKGQKFCDHECYAASLRVAIKDRFWSKVNRGHPDDCWLWTAKARLGRTRTFPGYGSILGIVNGKRRPCYSNRVAWELTYGPIPDGLFVLHRCDVSLCCNPLHLFLGTQATNLDDARQKGRLLPRGVYQARRAAALNNVEPVATVQVPVRGELVLR
jgi:HNH endonuclease